MTISERIAFFFLAIMFAVLVEAQSQGDDAVVGADDILRQKFLRYALENSGDAERGKVMFNHPEKALCSKCHLLTGMEKSGPNLDGIADKYPFEQLARRLFFMFR